jgi:kynurenine formamidase
MKIIDLSYPIETGMPVYPGDTEVNIHDERTWRRMGFGCHLCTAQCMPARILMHHRTSVTATL